MIEPAQSSLDDVPHRLEQFHPPGTLFRCNGTHT